MDMVLLKINTIQSKNSNFKPILLLTDFPVDIPVAILKMDKKNTKFGKKI